MRSTEVNEVGAGEMETKIPAVEKLVEVTASGIGGVAGPLLAEWRARKEGRARVIAAEADRDVLRIQAEAQAEARSLLVGDVGGVVGRVELADGITQRIEYQELKRHANIASTVGTAALQLEGKMVPGGEADHDWTARFFDGVQDVSSEEMRELWGRVLAGEVERPGSTSIRALSVLRDLDAKTAQTFSKLCSAAVYLEMCDGETLDARVPSLGGDASQNALLDFGLGYRELTRLNEHGLVIGDYNSYLDYVVVDDELDGSALLRHQGKYWDWVNEGPAGKERIVRIHGVAMTTAGCELSRVVWPEPMPGYLGRLEAFLSGRGFRMTEVA